MLGQEVPLASKDVVAQSQRWRKMCLSVSEVRSFRIPLADDAMMWTVCAPKYPLSLSARPLMEGSMVTRAFVASRSVPPRPSLPSLPLVTEFNSGGDSSHLCLFNEALLCAPPLQQCSLMWEGESMTCRRVILFVCLFCSFHHDNVLKFNYYLNESVHGGGSNRAEKTFWLQGSWQRVRGKKRNKCYHWMYRNMLLWKWVLESPLWLALYWNHS